MKERRASSGATYDTAHGLVLTGGHDGTRLLNTAEHTFDGVTFDSFTAIPIEVFLHCLVTLDNGGDLFQTGGWLSEDRPTRETFIYRKDSGRWEAVEDMPTARDSE